ncbi:DUF3438 family protein [Thiocystis violascens]|uniref:Type II secretory pathway, component PulD n=1 Tax=Thiocystis violascens (strain ATCC 17096 / DSM 198 / 6111) TaxID=765911 RepID=I3Y5I5_THIV6|nr:DUF3438 family protein [Thiocystis violascens]AFL72253.1 type II secretory pathway, component PulD [Thiocystis violascens DSM 198]
MRHLLFFIACLSLCAVAPAHSAASDVTMPLREIEFSDASVQDAIRVIAEQTGVNIVATREAGGRRFTLFLRALTVREAIDSIARVAGLWYRFNDKTGVYLVMTTEEYFRDITVFREEKTEVFTLKFQNVLKVANTVQAMFGEDRVSLDVDNSNDDLDLPGATLNAEFSNSTSGRGRGGSRGRNTSQGRGSGRKASVDETLQGMTQDQIQRLEQTKLAPGEDPLMLSEETIIKVRKQESQSPIYLAINREHNQLFARTSDEQAMVEIRRLVAESDRPTPQVLLEMKVLSVTLDDEFQYAFDFSFGSEVKLTGPNDGQPPNPLSPESALGSEGTIGSVNSSLMAGSTFVFQAMNDKVRARLQLMERDGRVNILATPLLLAANNRPAKIFIGEQAVLTTGFTAQTSTSAGSGGVGNTFITTPVPETETVEVGNTLTILPSINADRTVVMRMLQEASRIKTDGGMIPVVAGGAVTQVAIDTVDISTMEGTAMAKDGLAVVVGGMITETTSNGERKVPVLGDVPMLGALFKQVDRTKKREQLILLITPHVFSTPEEAEAVSRHRLGDVARTPSEIDVYLDRLERTRSRNARGRVDNAAIRAAAPEPIAPRSAREPAYLALTRFAAERIRSPRLLQRAHANVENVQLTNNRPFHLVADATVEATPKRGWRDGGLFVTAVVARNRGTLTNTLDERRFKGQWLAAAAQTPTLAPGERTHVFLISDRPFHEVAVP